MIMRRFNIDDEIYIFTTFAKAEKKLSTFDYLGTMRKEDFRKGLVYSEY